MSAAQLPTALIVDDEAGIREVFTEILTRKGYRVVEARDAEEALKKISAEPIDLAFIDIWMPPGIDGIELLKQVKEEGKLTFAAAIVSGHTEVSSTVEAMKCGAIDVISKPVERKRIEALIDKVKQEKSKEVFSSSVQEINLGRGQALIKLKGQLLKAADNKRAITFTGPYSRGSELFAAMLHRLGRRWMRTADLTLLENNIDRWLADLRFGTLYIAGIERARPGQLHGLAVALRNAHELNLQVALESAKTLDELRDSGALEAGLHEELAGNEARMPPFSDFAKEIKLLAPVLAQRFCVIDGLATASFDNGALKMLENCASNWGDDGLNVLTGFGRLLLRMANDGVVSKQDVMSVLNIAVAPEGKVSFDEETFNLELREARAVFEKIYLLRLLEQTNNQMLDAVKISGLERTYLYRKIKTLLNDEEISRVK